MNRISKYFRTDSGRLLQYLLMAVVMLIVALMWQMLLPIKSVASCRPAEPKVMFDLTWFCGFEGWEVLVKVAVVLIVLRFWVNPIAAVLMGFANQMDMLRDQQNQDDMNDSNTRLNAWAALAMGWVVIMTPYTVLPNYLANLLFRLPMTFIWAVILTAVLVRYQLGIKNMMGYVSNFRLPKNEAAAVWTGVACLLAAWLVVSI